MFGELHLGLKASRLLHDDVLSLPPDISLNRVVMDLNKLCTAISSRLSLNRTHNIGGFGHHRCANDVEELARIAHYALNDIKPVPLTTFGREQAEKQVISWDSVLMNHADEMSG
jgi:hypothetical protein